MPSAALGRGRPASREAWAARRNDAHARITVSVRQTGFSQARRRRVVRASGDKDGRGGVRSRDGLAGVERLRGGGSCGSEALRDC